MGEDFKAVSREVGKDVRVVSKEVGKDAVAVEKAVVKDVQLIEDKLVSIGPRFTFLKSDDSMRDKLDASAKRELRNAERSLNKVEKEVRAADATN